MHGNRLGKITNSIFTITQAYRSFIITKVRSEFITSMFVKYG